jgi:hypothetical protein
MKMREHIHPNHLEQIHLLEDDQQCLRKQGCSESWTPVFCSLRCRIKRELYLFFTCTIMSLVLWMALTFKQCHLVRMW